MQPLKKLALRKETLTELGTDDLLAIVGGEPPQPTPPIYTPTTKCTGVYPTLPVTYCIQTG